MSNFIQLHFLTSYPASNLNRDDLGRPKTMIYGGAQRLRVSSQCLKRAWRCSEVFMEALAGNTGYRTRSLEKQMVRDPLDKADIEKDIIEATVKSVSAAFRNPADLKPKEKKNPAGKGKTLSKEMAAAKGTEEAEESTETEAAKGEQLVFYSMEELSRIVDIVQRVAAGETPSLEEYKNLLQGDTHNTADIAMFGRMLASSPKFNTDASVQVAHAVSVHKTTIEDDFFTAVDDLNKKEGDDGVGAAMMGSIEFAAPLLYQYVCINKTQLLKNLGGNKTLADMAIKAFVQAALTTSPSGKQNTFASRAYASYALAEYGSFQPRSLAGAFLRSVTGEDQLQTAIERLEEEKKKMDTAYGMAPTSSYSMNVSEGTGTLKELLSFLVTA